MHKRRIHNSSGRSAGAPLSPGAGDRPRAGGRCSSNLCKGVACKVHVTNRFAQEHFHIVPVEQLAIQMCFIK